MRAPSIPLVDRHDELAQSVIDGDDQIDELYLEIDHGVLQLLALQSPVAADLRLVSAILHSCLHLERIGDQAVNVAKIHLMTETGRGSEPMRNSSTRWAPSSCDDPHRDGRVRPARPDVVHEAPGDGRSGRSAEPATRTWRR